MLRLAAITLLSAIAIASFAACGGGGGGPRFAATVVPIHHLDFTGVELGINDFFSRPFADQYPEVVAEVNGVPIGGKALAAVEASLELQRRGALSMDASSLAQQLLAQQTLVAVASTDPLESLIDDELNRQAVERLELLPSYEEALAYTREQEERFLHPRGTVSPENRQQTLEILRLQGLPTEDWASNEQLVEGYRWGMGLAKLRSSVCPTFAKPRTPTPGVFRSSVACEDFLRRERQRADIVYYVRWDD